jgi:nitric oxide synthase oxygenase domain/subunit
MLDKATIKQINEFVYQKPRTVQELALLLKVNWRTADSYVEKISAENLSVDEVEEINEKNAKRSTGIVENLLYLGVTPPYQTSYKPKSIIKITNK